LVIEIPEAGTAIDRVKNVPEPVRDINPVVAKLDNPSRLTLCSCIDFQAALMKISAKLFDVFNLSMPVTPVGCCPVVPTGIWSAPVPLIVIVFDATSGEIISKLLSKSI
jgi:hypothetical protein